VHNPTADPGAVRLIEVFGLSIGRGDPSMLGPTARFATDTLARALSGFDDLIARPHHALLGADLDANLGPAPEDDTIPVDRVRFILREALPVNGILRRLTLQQGGAIALTGRIGMDRDNLVLALNLWDVRGAVLLWCTALTTAADDLPKILGQVAGDAAWSLQASGAESRSEAINTAKQAVGTDSLGAFEAMAGAVERIRRASVGGEPPPPDQIARVLIGALEQDPHYEAPRLLLTEIAIERLRQGDAAFAKALLATIGRLTDDRLIYGLLRFEAQLVLGRIDAAADLLSAFDARYPGHVSLAKARGRLGTQAAKEA
jgi:hypothetical protein